MTSEKVLSLTVAALSRIQLRMFPPKSIKSLHESTSLRRPLKTTKKNTSKSWNEIWFFCYCSLIFNRWLFLTFWKETKWIFCGFLWRLERKERNEDNSSGAVFLSSDLITIRLNRLLSHSTEGNKKGVFRTQIGLFFMHSLSVFYLYKSSPWF